MKQRLGISSILAAMVALAIGATPVSANAILKAAGPFAHSGTEARVNLVSDGGNRIRAECSVSFGSVSRKITACQVRNGSGTTRAVGAAKGPANGSVATQSAWFTSGCTTTSYRAVIGYDVGSAHFTNQTALWRCVG